jgi:hypothetical protein
MRTPLGISLLLASALCARATTTFSVGPSPALVNVGDMFTLDVSITDVSITTDATNLFGFQFDLLFPTFLNVTGVTEQGFFFNNGCCFLYDAPDNSAGTVTNVLDASFGSPESTGTDTLVSFQFLVVGPGSGSVNLQNVLLATDDPWGRHPGGLH